MLDVKLPIEYKICLALLVVYVLVLGYIDWRTEPKAKPVYIVNNPEAEVTEELQSVKLYSEDGKTYQLILLEESL